MTRTSVLLTALLVVGAATAGLSGAVASNGELAADSEATVQNQEPGTAEVPLDSDEVFWQGQLVRFTAGEANASEVWAVRRVQNGEVGGLVTEMLLDANGSATFQTRGLDGQYVVVDEQERPVVFVNGEAQRVGELGDASFQVTEQTLEVTFEDDLVRNDDHPDARTDLRLESNRAGYRPVFFSEQLNASQLADVFPTVEVSDGNAVVTRNVGADEVLDANFTGVAPGTYNITVFPTDGTVQETATISVTEPVEGSAALSNATYTEQRGDVVEFNVTLEDTDTATVDLGSQNIGYHARFTVVDENGDGVVTVELDTYRAGQSENAPGVSVAGEDGLRNATLRTDPVPGRLDAAAYGIEVSVGTTRTAVGSIQLTERSTDGIQVWTAPESASVRSVADVADVATQDTDIAYQDWAIVQVEASGLYAYVENRNVSDLNNETTGLSMSVVRTAEMNRPAEPVGLDQAELFTDEANDQFFVVLPTNGLERDVTYRAHFNVSDANPYVPEGENETLVADFTVVERSVSFDQPIEVPASSEATITGSSSVAPGTEFQVEVSNTAENPFLRQSTATVDSEGDWQATVDLSDVPPGTNFTVDVVEAEVNATGVVVSAGAAAGVETTPANGTTTTPAETTTPETTTPEDGTEGATETTTTTTTTEDEGGAAGEEGTTTTPEDGAGETTPAEGEAAGTTTAEGTVTEAASAPASGFGVVAVGVGLALLAGGALLALRRR